MAKIRVYLFTYRRPELLKRALSSLIAQSFEDWICELHNDDPEDIYPAELVAQCNDARVILHQHARNWGPVASFNHAFKAAGEEEFGSLLEDDNWWEPEFLATALSALLNNPKANVAWSNMTIWSEQTDASWVNTGRTVWDVYEGAKAEYYFQWPVPLQCFNGLHSNGAMVFRASASRTALVPDETPFDIIEPVRERLLPGGWVLLTRALANFALTLQTARRKDRSSWAKSQLLVAGSYLATTNPGRESVGQLWFKLRTQSPPATNLLFHAALAGIQSWTLLRHANLTDWLRFLKYACRHPITLVRVLRFRSAFPVLWPLLLEASRARTAEANSLHSSAHLYCKQVG